MEEKINENNPLKSICSVILNNYKVDMERIEKLVLISLLAHKNYQTGLCNPSIKTIQNEWFYASDREVIKALRGLQEKKIISKETIKRKNYYSINIDLLNRLDYPQNVGNLQNEGNPQNVGNGNPQNVGTNKERTKKEQRIIYKDLKFIDDVIDKVKITEEEYKKLIDKYSKELVNKQILALDNYIANGKGQKYKDHYRALNLWCKNEVKHNKEYSTKNLMEEEEKYIIG